MNEKTNNYILKIAGEISSLFGIGFSFAFNIWKQLHGKLFPYFQNIEGRLIRKQVVDVISPTIFKVTNNKRFLIIGSLIILILFFVILNLAYKNGGYASGNGSYIGPDGGSYYGAWEDYKVHGKGTYIWPDSSKYFGMWKYNKMHGKGTFTWPNPEKPCPTCYKKFVGNFSEDEFKTGTYFLFNGEKLNENGDVIKEKKSSYSDALELIKKTNSLYANFQRFRIH